MTRSPILVTCVAIITGDAAGAPPQPDVVLADFEAPTYAAWTASGEAFGAGPARGTLPNQMHVSGFEGQGLVNTYLAGDGAVGRLASPDFVLSRKAITFLIGGGAWAGKTCMNLLIDGKVVRTATGPNTQPGGSEALERMNWDVAEHLGKTARIEIVDDATGGWGHINVDHIVMTDDPPPGMVDRPSRSITAEKRCLNLPIRNDAPMRRLALSVGGRVVNDFEAAITDRDPDYWVFLDISPWAGKQIELRAERLPAGGAALDKIEQSDAAKGAEPLYAEKLRPQFHFTTQRGWINDPNGMVYLGGEYHLYYQHNPFGWSARNMHWGHAVSRDLVHWEELPTAFAPRTFGDWVWSGSAVVDAANTAGWKRGGSDVIVAAFTSTGRGECIAYSTDRGRTFTEFEGNPVVTHTTGEGRDPRLLWYTPPGGGAGHWVMAVYNEDRSAPEPDRRGVAFYTSPDLKRWTYTSRIGGFYECPDIFELPVDAGKNGKKWVLTAADSHYVLGQFDGKTFTPDEPRVKLPGNRSDRFYAAQTFTGTPDGRCIQIGWGRIDTPGMPFNQMMSFPCELTLRTTPEGVRLFSWPVAEIEKLYNQSCVISELPLLRRKAIASVPGGLADVAVVLRVLEAKTIELNVRGMPVRIDVAAGRISCADKSAPLAVRNGRVNLRILVDRTSLEIFANDGEVAMLVAGAFTGDKIEMTSDASAQADEFTLHELKSSWNAGN